MSRLAIALACCGACARSAPPPAVVVPLVVDVTVEPTPVEVTVVPPSVEVTVVPTPAEVTVEPTPAEVTVEPAPAQPTQPTTWPPTTLRDDCFWHYDSDTAIPRGKPRLICWKGDPPVSDPPY